MSAKITRNNLIIGILAFLLVVNILMIFNLNQLYFRAILSFIFLITIPGLLIMLCFKIRSIGFWEYLVYTVGLSIAFIMFAGLAVNWILPWLHITDKPLSLYPILISFDIFLLALSFVAYKRNSDLKFQPKFPKFTWLDRIFMIIPFCFPFMAIIGAFLLNNHGTNIITMIMLGAIAVYVFCVVLFHKKLNENVFPWAILMISISLLFSGWLRSWNISGVDVNREYSIFQLTKEKAFWDLSNFKDAYNAMLSVTILPVILSLFVKINDQFIIKLFTPLIFSFLVVCVYLIQKRYFSSTISFFAAFFFISQPISLAWSANPLRQDTAFFFFGLMFLVLFSKEVGRGLKKTIFLIFGFSMIVSHYSTSYIALPLFTLSCLLILAYKKLEKRKIKKGKLKPEEKHVFNLTWGLVLLLLLFGFLWYTQVTNTADGLIDFASKSFSNIQNIFSKEVQVEKQTPIEQLNPFYTPTSLSNLLAEYNSQAGNRSDTINYYSSESYKIRLQYPKSPYFASSAFLNSNVPVLRNILEIVVGRIFLVFGAVYLFFKFKQDKEYKFVSIFSLVLFLGAIFLPFISIDYDLARVYQQFLIILCIFPVLVVSFIGEKIRSKSIFMAVVFLLYFLLLSGFAIQLIGGSEISMRLNNFGFEHSLYYSYKSEILSGDWLSEKYEDFSPINADARASARFNLASKSYSLAGSIKKDVLPQSIRKNAYVYLSHTNIFDGVAFKSFRRILLSLNFPIEFLNENKNKVYSNGGSEVFK